MASGDTLVEFFPGNAEFPSSNYATIDYRSATTLHPVLDFNDTTDESVYFTAIMPRRYAGNGITIYIHYAMSTATSGNVYWQTAFERIGDQQQDIDTDGFASAQTTGAVTVPGTSGNVDICTTTHTNGAQIDSIAVGEAFRLKINRDADTDSASGDAELVGIELKET